MSVREDMSFEIMKRHDVDYALVIFGGAIGLFYFSFFFLKKQKKNRNSLFQIIIGYSGDDINKFLWMIRIAQGVYPNDVKEEEFFTPKGEYKVKSSFLLNS
mgnify:CR=1 FL=1